MYLAAHNRDLVTHKRDLTAHKRDLSTHKRGLWRNNTFCIISNVFGSELTFEFCTHSRRTASRPPPAASSWGLFMSVSLSLAVSLSLSLCFSLSLWLSFSFSFSLSVFFSLSLCLFLSLSLSDLYTPPSSPPPCLTSPCPPLSRLHLLTRLLALLDAECCSVLQCVAVCCSVLQSVGCVSLFCVWICLFSIGLVRVFIGLFCIWTDLFLCEN